MRLVVCIFLCTAYIMAEEISIENNKALNIPLIPTSCLVIQPKVVSSKKIKVKKTISNLDILEGDISPHLKVTQPIVEGVLELEDEYYMKVRSVDMNDSRLPALTLDLAQKHMKAKEYLIAEFYVKLYIRDYAFGEALDRAWYIGTKSLFMQFKKSQSQEGLFTKIVASSRYFANTFLQSKYRKEVASMLKASIGIAKQRNEEIAAYYEKAGKKKAAAYYREKNKQFERGGY